MVHTYYDHVSILKFIERNWRLQPLSTRSRDNLPNPVAGATNSNDNSQGNNNNQGNDNNQNNLYVPRNMPAIGDLMEMFNFSPRS